MHSSYHRESYWREIGSEFYYNKCLKEIILCYYLDFFENFRVHEFLRPLIMSRDISESIKYQITDDVTQKSK